MYIAEHDLRPRRLDRRGVALPIALLGLVAVSLLVTTALITSSTELALSQAHQDGTRALYASDAAIEGFVAQRVAMTANPELRFANGSYPVDGYAVGVAELFRTPAVLQADGAYERRETYSLVAGPQDGRGRSVGAMIEAIRRAEAITLNIDSGLTVGTDTEISGSATISDGSSAGAACDSASATAAIRHADDTSVRQRGNGHDIFGSIVQDDREAAELMEWVLDGHSVEELTNLAHIRFGPMFSRPTFNNGSGPSHLAGNPAYRWGCPAQMVNGCTAAQAAYYPTVAIDANGSQMDITGDHGQGILLIRNGDVHIRGNFKYAGIIVVEGTLRVTGTPRIEGAVISMGDETVIDPGDDSTASGNSLIRFNKCQIVEAQKGLTINSLDMSAQTVATPTYAWYEVVR